MMAVGEDPNPGIQTVDKSHSGAHRGGGGGFWREGKQKARSVTPRPSDEGEYMTNVLECRFLLAVLSAPMPSDQRRGGRAV